MQISQFKLVGQTRLAHPQEIESQLTILVSDPALVTALWRGLWVVSGKWTEAENLREWKTEL